MKKYILSFVLVSIFVFVLIPKFVFAQSANGLVDVGASVPEGTWAPVGSFFSDYDYSNGTRGPLGPTVTGSILSKGSTLSSDGSSLISSDQKGCQSSGGCAGCGINGCVAPSNTKTTLVSTAGSGVGVLDIATSWIDSYLPPDPWYTWTCWKNVDPKKPPVCVHTKSIEYYMQDYEATITSPQGMYALLSYVGLGGGPYASVNDYFAQMRSAAMFYCSQSKSNENNCSDGVLIDKYFSEIKTRLQNTSAKYFTAWGVTPLSGSVYDNFGKLAIAASPVIPPVGTNVFFKVTGILPSSGAIGSELTVNFSEDSATFAQDAGSYYFLVFHPNSSAITNIPIVPAVLTSLGVSNYKVTAKVPTTALGLYQVNLSLGTRADGTGSAVRVVSAGNFTVTSGGGPVTPIQCAPGDLFNYTTGKPCSTNGGSGTTPTVPDNSQPVTANGSNIKEVSVTSGTPSVVHIYFTEVRPTQAEQGYSYFIRFQKYPNDPNTKFIQVTPATTTKGFLVSGEVPSSFFGSGEYSVALISATSDLKYLGSIMGTAQFGGANSAGGNNSNPNLGNTGSSGNNPVQCASGDLFNYVTGVACPVSTAGTPTNTNSPQTVSVYVTALNIRSGPYTSSNIIGSIANGQVVKVISSITGESVNGNSKWWQTEKGYIWSGGTRW